MKANEEVEILIVEDDTIISKLHKFSLRGYFQGELHICMHGKEAVEHLDKIAAERKKILILLDLNMPVMNGWEFLEICNSRPYNDKLHVVIVTSSSFIDDREKALSFKQVKAYYAKPLKHEKIPEIFQQAEFSEVIPSRS